MNYNFEIWRVNCTYILADLVCLSHIKRHLSLITPTCSFVVSVVLKDSFLRVNTA